MKNPSFSQSFHSFVGATGTLFVFVIIILYPRISIELEASKHQKMGSIEDIETGGVVIVQSPDSSTSTAAKLPNRIQMGHDSYQLYCASCHGMSGEERTIAMTASDLFDAESTYGTDPESIRKVIEDGVIAEGMVPWKMVLPPEEITAIVEYIRTNT